MYKLVYLYRQPGCIYVGSVIISATWLFDQISRCDKDKRWEMNMAMEMSREPI